MILALLRERTGVDFSQYKSGTVRRRLDRRMVAAKAENEDDYLKYLRGHPREMQFLFDDLLIPVTEFFRDPAVFETVAKLHLAPRVREKPFSSPIRIWVPACSTGEEVYSLAIILAELMEKKGIRRSVQLFGTDVNEAALDRARAGIYPDSIRKQMSAKRLEQFFDPVTDGFRIRQPIRDRCVFARHDLIVDPPFSNLDLISCRNLLIYFSAELQKKVVPTFYFGLKPSGGLLLGPAETIGEFSGLFVLKDKAGKFYLRNRAPAVMGPRLEMNARSGRILPDLAVRKAAAAEWLLPKVPDLRSAVKKLLKDSNPKAGKVGTAARSSRARRGGEKSISARAKGKTRAGIGMNGADEKEGFKAALEENQRLRNELLAIRTSLHAVIEQAEATHEELRAANEEIVSSNEELQSTNEELENTKEKLQSTNEELASVNDELTKKNSDLEKANVLSSRFEAIVTSSDDAIISKDLNGIIHTWNDGAQKIFGYSAEEVIGKPVSILIPPERADEEPGILARLRRGEGIDHYETIRRHKDGRLLAISLSVSPVKNSSGVIVGAAKIARDVTAQKRAETEIKMARDEAQRANQAKDHFLAALSHELRTPLNPVLLVASEAAGNAGLPEKARADFQLILNNIELEAQLIDDLLDLSRISAGKLRMQRRLLDAHDILVSTIRMVRPELDRKGVNLVERFSTTEGPISGDTIRLHQVFWNVLKNAIKFTPVKGTVTVETSIHDDHYLVRISDTGIGLTESELARAFDAFNQGSHAEDLQQQFGGLGLGLTISKKLVEAQDGNISASSQGRGLGAIFTIEFPLSSGSPGVAAELESPGTVQSIPNSRQARILVVEDHIPTRSVISRILSGRGHEVEAAGSLREALEAVSKARFDLVISDIGLPDGSGYDLFNEIRRHFPTIKGVALTGYGMDEDRANAQTRGFNLHLTKPIRIQALDRALAEVLGP